MWVTPALPILSNFPNSCNNYVRRRPSFAPREPILLGSAMTLICLHKSPTERELHPIESMSRWP
jgi:hypothetical protein